MSVTYPTGAGYSCWQCGGWVPHGCTHFCPTYQIPQWSVNPIITTTLTTEAGSLLLRVSRDEGFWVVTDVIGTRYGHAETLKDALAEWESQVSDLIAVNDAELGDPILSELRAYRQALGY